MIYTNESEIEKTCLKFKEKIGRRPIIAIDFDGTMHPDTFPNVSKCIPEAIEIIKKIGPYCSIILHTCRDNESLSDAIRLIYSEFHDELIEKKIHWSFNQNTKEQGIHFETSNKIYYDICIDDKNLGGLIPYEKWIPLILQDLENFIKRIENKHKK